MKETHKVIAFIPARGGSKSIPLKNIRPLCGKPLVCWSIEALERCSSVDEIIVSTDSDAIAETVLGYHYRKVSIFRRTAKNAGDTASTESAMLEYIETERLRDDICFMLVQATSPLTQTEHFEEALNMYATESYDSILSCVRQKRFFWSAEGKSLNYNFHDRPRRQEFEGILMENGAFYINSVKNIRYTNNRLSGKIGIYEMPEYTAVEIDEPDDWTILENLMLRHAQKKNPSKFIKLFLSDVDGVLTDAGMYYSENGDELKKFNTHDGMAIRLLKEHGIKTGFITSEETKIVENRAKKLQVDYLIQGKNRGGKLVAAQEICRKEKILLSEVAYIGDDINCFELLSSVGLAACPANSVSKIKNIPGIILLSKKGGEGAVREFIDNYLLHS